LESKETKFSEKFSFIFSGQFQTDVKKTIHPLMCCAQNEGKSW